MQKIINIIFIVVIAGFAIKMAKRQIAIDSWPSTQATITSYSIEEPKDSATNLASNDKNTKDHQDEYQVRFIYNYQIGGITYNGNFVVDDLNRQYEVDSVLRKHKNGKSIFIKYNPDYPSDSELSS